MKYLSARLFLAFFLLLAPVQSVHAQEQIAGDAAVFDDWRVACDQAQPCRMAQSVVQVASKRLILQVKVFKGDEPTMLLSFPLGILLNTGWQYQIDGRSPTLRPFEICNADGCHAGIKLSQSLLAALKRGRTLSVTFFDAGRTKVNPQISLIGFTKAYESLP
ncbi:hypothetical protein DDZ14_02805 [Maritimibacter sp. 55A14]|uniref:invasion associated locus B family protein n=1 Tax=Maritimibacter sp. 55A14 TaxID=2174844 RepID=UPI000D61EF0E|nr:invasion associated locus B family protein [Maritimibacter sp. 55A14]PWE34102.1 hypothetical protein DDZ14_02805 [Maritimibacter sp. 55A14]